jgi:large-conductance mechanosensitive channel
VFRRGYITVDQFFKFVGVEKNKLGLRVFDMLNSIENDQFMDFGEFLKAVSTFCMLGWVLWFSHP